MTGGKSEELRKLEFNLDPNEASGLLSIRNEALLESHGWDIGFWVVLDDDRIEDCVAAIGHQRGSEMEEGWEIDRFRAEPTGDDGKTEDAESIARNGEWVYAFGSHFGSKDGPLQPKRGFVARFREADVRHAFEDPAVEMDISRKSFVLHRLVNDALKSGGPHLMPLGERSREAFIDQTVERGEEKDKKWKGLVHEDDYPLNIEGAAFRADGTLLLGLRFPVSADGYPLLVELGGIESLFDSNEQLPEVLGFRVVDAVGKNGSIAGVRDLVITGGPDDEELHLVTGNIDSRDKGSTLLQDYPGGRDTVATHFQCQLPPEAPDNEHSEPLRAEVVREFPELPRVEGIAITNDDRFFYVTDEDEGVHLRLTRLVGS